MQAASHRSSPGLSAWLASSVQQNLWGLFTSPKLDFNGIVIQVTTSRLLIHKIR